MNPPRYGNQITHWLTDESDALDYPATERNREPIWRVLEPLLPPTGAVLEVGSGSGQHICAFALRRPDLQWIPSNPEAELNRSVVAWRQISGASALADPVQLDARAAWPRLPSLAGVVAINVLHVSPPETTEALLASAAHCVAVDGFLLIYGPFQKNGGHTSPGNAAFHASLQQQDPSWGLRAMEQVLQRAASLGWVEEATVAMPANNHCLVLRRAGSGAAGP